MNGLSRDAAELVIGLEAVAAAGITLTPDEMDYCSACNGSYRRKNKWRHMTGRRHRRARMRVLTDAASH